MGVQLSFHPHDRFSSRTMRGAADLKSFFNHQRETWEAVQVDIRRHFELLAQQPDEVLRHIGSAYAEERTERPALALAA